MSRIYKPYNLELNKTPIIVYPIKDENPLEKVFKSNNHIIKHLKELYGKYEDLEEGDYHIVFVWNLEGKRMTDVWIHSLENYSDSGPLIDVITFEDTEEVTDAGVASGDSILVLAYEEMLRREVKDLDVYLDRSNVLPKFPMNFGPEDEFKF